MDLILDLVMKSMDHLQTSRLLGGWQYIGYEVEQVFTPIDTEALSLQFIFDDEGTNKLIWTRRGQIGFCERKARFQVRGQQLKQEVIEVHLQNRPDCAKDPDMQMGRISKTPFSFLNDRLRFHLPLGDKTLLYILKRVNL